MSSHEGSDPFLWELLLGAAVLSLFRPQSGRTRGPERQASRRAHACRGFQCRMLNPFCHTHYFKWFLLLNHDFKASITFSHFSLPWVTQSVTSWNGSVLCVWFTSIEPDVEK